MSSHLQYNGYSPLFSGACKCAIVWKRTILLAPYLSSSFFLWSPSFTSCPLTKAFFVLFFLLGKLFLRPDFYPYNFRTWKIFSDIEFLIAFPNWKIFSDAKFLIQLFRIGKFSPTPDFWYYFITLKIFLRCHISD